MYKRQQNIVLTYDLNGDPRDPKFSCRVKSTAGLKVGTITADQANCTFTIPVTAVMKMGVEQLTITVDNGGKMCIRDSFLSLFPFAK